METSHAHLRGWLLFLFGLWQMGRGTAQTSVAPRKYSGGLGKYYGGHGMYSEGAGIKLQGERMKLKVDEYFLKAIVHFQTVLILPCCAILLR